MTEIGPDAPLAAAMLGAWVGLGAIIGYLLAPAAHQVRRRRAEGDDELDEDFEEGRDGAAGVAAAGVAAAGAGAADEEELTASRPVRPLGGAVDAGQAGQTGQDGQTGQTGQGGQMGQGPENGESVDEFTARMRARREDATDKSSPLRPLRRD